MKTVSKSHIEQTYALMHTLALHQCRNMYISEVALMVSNTQHIRYYVHICVYIYIYIQVLYVLLYMLYILYITVSSMYAVTIIVFICVI